MSGHLLLVGMMGSGKSTVGPLVARRLRRGWVDVDEEVVRESGMQIEELFATSGEAAFRRAESHELARVLATGAPLVVSVGGGAVLDPANRSLLRASGRVVWLRARPETLAARLAGTQGRPLLAGDPRRVLTRIARRRRGLYEEVADAVVDVDDLSAQVVADRVADVERAGPKAPATGVGR